MVNEVNAFERTNNSFLSPLLINDSFNGESENQKIHHSNQNALLYFDSKRIDNASNEFKNRQGSVRLN